MEKARLRYCITALAIDLKCFTSLRGICAIIILTLVGATICMRPPLRGFYGGGAIQSLPPIQITVK